MNISRICHAIHSWVCEVCMPPFSVFVEDCMACLLHNQACMKILILIAALCLASSVVQARDWRWVGPPAGNIEQIEPDPGNSQLWYVINNRTLYRYGVVLESTDRGKKWKPLNPEIERITGKRVDIFDMTDPQIHPIYLATSSGLFVEVNSP